jgi:alpha-tubulin suppressor-like RCC1 family protein
MRQFRTIIRQQGYVLPATIVLGLATSIVSIGLLQATSISSQSLSNTSYQAIAQEAANAGIKEVQSCVENNYISWTTLTPFTDCAGSPKSTVNPNTNLDVSTVTHDGNNWRSSYSVGAPAPPVNNLLTALAVGTVKLYNSAGVVVQTYTANAKITLPSTPTTEKVATGNMITDIKNDASDCAISNGNLYCWGDNSAGQLGRGYTGNGNDPVTGASIGKPQVVKGTLTGKTVTYVSVAERQVCAVADGTPYCWGDNGYGQLGNNTNVDTNIPKTDVPRTSSGPLSGQYVKEISTSSRDDPANAVWPFSTAYPHTCALTQDGVVSCWGDGGFRQNTGGGLQCIPFTVICRTIYPSYNLPTLVDGYTGSSDDNSHPLKGQKSQHVGASSHDSCVASEGKLVCWGVPAPLPIQCNSVLFSESYQTIVLYPWQICVQSFSDGYDTSAIGGSALSGQFIDNNLWNLSANETCHMASTNFVCFGQTPAFNPVWFQAWGPPFVVMANADVTDTDNGDYIPSYGAAGLYCIVNRGGGYCSGTDSTYTGTGTSGYINFQPLTASITSGLTGKYATRIAAGQGHGCVVANGQLFCWGNGTNGVLGDDNKNNHSAPTAIITGSSTVGIDAGTYAAHSSISVGTDFACSIVNTQVFCWGDNNNGKLGLGQATFSTLPNNLNHPQRLPALASKHATKVSAGKDHACAIADGNLYCWGDNSKGQLGIGTTVDNPTPQQVGHNAGMTGIFDNKRVTDVSAGDKNTCAVVDGQAYCWGDNSHRQLGNNDILHIEKDSPILVNNNGIGHNLHTDMNVTAVTVGTDHVCAIANADAYCWGSNANGKTGIGSFLFDSDPTLLDQGTASTSVASGGDPGPNNTRPMVSDISAGTDSTCAIINSKVSCWGSNANGRTGQNTASNLPTPTLVPTQIKGAAKDYYATAVSVGDTHACAILNGNSSATNGNVFCWGSGADGRLGDENQSLFAPTNVVQASNQAVNNPANTISGSGSDNDTIGKSITTISAGANSTCDIANGTIQCWGLGASGQIGNSLYASQLLPKTTSDYAIAVYVKPKIY